MKLIAENYYGNAVVEKKLENYFVSITTYKPEIKLPLHSHENSYLSMNLGCPYHEFGETTAHTIECGQVVFRPASYQHSNQFIKKKGVCFNIEILNDADEDSYKTVFNQFNLEQARIGMQKICAAYINKYKPDELDWLISESLIQSCDDHSYSPTPFWYKIITEYINDQYDQSIKLKDLSHVTGVHPNYICRKFKQIKGVRISEYIRHIRLEKAFDLLISNKYQLTKIGLETGFYDQSHFSKSFKNVYGTSPRKLLSEYKRLISYN